MSPRRICMASLEWDCFFPRKTSRLAQLVGSPDRTRTARDKRQLLRAGPSEIAAFLDDRSSYMGSELQRGLSSRRVAHICLTLANVGLFAISVPIHRLFRFPTCGPLLPALLAVGQCTRRLGALVRRYVDFPATGYQRGPGNTVLP